MPSGLMTERQVTPDKALQTRLCLQAKIHRQREGCLEGDLDAVWIDR